LNEDLQGLTFDSSGYVTGVQPVFLTNLDDMFAKANTHKVSLYLTFFNFNLKDQFGKTLPSGAVIKNFVNDTTARQRVLDNCVGLIANRYKANAALFGFDLINESNMGADNGSYTWANMRSFGQAAASKIHGIQSNLQVTMSTQWRDAFDPIHHGGAYGGLGFDFYDYHDYADAPNLKFVNTLGAEKPVLLGECGQVTNSDAAQNSAVSAYLNQGRDRGWAGVLQWAYHYPGSTDVYRLVNSGGAWRPAASTLATFGANLSTFSATATSASSVARGSTLPISTSFTCTQNRLYNAVVDAEIYNSSNVRVAQTWWTAQDFYKGDVKGFTWNWAVPSNLPTGTYRVSLAVFGPNWTPLRLWVANARTFTVN
jgi:hypothetical protein